jgi:hypothetical protein
MLGVLSIRFNHDGNDGNVHALNVRKNQTMPAMLPEWQAGISVTWNQSVAAYAGDAAKGKSVSVQAQFAQLGTVLPSCEIRAMAAGSDGSPATLSGVPVLGSLESQTVSFDMRGASGVITFTTLNQRVFEAGIGANPVHWRWEARLDQSSPWLPFALTHHKIFTLLGPPAMPWTQAPFTAQNEASPWTDVLEVACGWAAGATSQRTAIERITRAMNALGGPLFEYDCPGGGASHYVTPATNYFDCSAFLERLDGGIGRGRLINCVDCATIVSTFANCVGCDLSQSRMGMNPPFFLCNPILAIGSSNWETPCGLPGFFFHEVAWSGDCTAADQVSDACLEVDEDDNPCISPHSPLLPTSELFGQSGDGDYRDRLAAPGGRLACEPQPSMRQRRSVAAADATQIVRLPLFALRALEETHASALEQVPSQTPPSRFFWRFFFSGEELPGWRLISSARHQNAFSGASLSRLNDVTELGLAQISTTLWAHHESPRTLLHVDSYECTSADVARQLTVRLLGEFQLPGITANAADVTNTPFFTSAGGASVLFSVGNHLHLVRAAEHNWVDVGGAARLIASHLIAHDSAPYSGPNHRAIQAGRTRETPVLHSMLTSIPPTRWYKFFSASGEFRAEPGRVIFHAASAGYHDITVTGVERLHSVVTDTLRVATS